MKLKRVLHIPKNSVLYPIEPLELSEDSMYTYVTTTKGNTIIVILDRQTIEEFNL
jgi:hypothetical protein